MRSRIITAAIVLLVGCSEARSANDRQPAADVEITLTPYFRDLRTVRSVHGRDTLTLLLDTGGGATLVTPTVALRLGCRPFGRDVGHRMNGELVEFQRCDSLSLGFPGWSRRIAPVAVFDVSALLPPELPRVDGVLALDAFAGQVVTIDWPRGRVIVHSAASSSSALDTAGLEIRLATGETGRMLTAYAKVAGGRGPLWFLIDSGNLRGTLIDSHVLRDSLLILGPDSSVELRVGLRAPLSSPASAGAFILDGALGTDYLQRGAVALDLRRISP